MEDDGLIVFGDNIKATSLNNGSVKLAGYLIRYGDPTTPDLSGDYFTKDTDFGGATESVTWFNHRMPVKLQKANIQVEYKKALQKAKLTYDDVGVFAEVVIEARNEYEKTIAELGKQGKLAWSSGTAPHLVERKAIKNGVFEITQWPLGTDASFTPRPAEPRNTNMIVSIKSLSPDTALPDKDESKSIQPNGDQNKMNDEIKAAVDAALAEREAKIKAEADSQAAVKAAEEAAYRKGVEDAQKAKAPAFNTKTELGFSEEKDAVPAFKHWMQTGQVNGGLITPDASYTNIKAAFNVTTGATGGYLVPDPLYAQIIAKRDIASFVRTAPTQKFTTPSDHLLVPTEATSHTDFVLTAESAAYDENEGTVGQTDILLKKYTKLVKVTEEFASYNGTNFDAWLMDALGRAEASTENTVATAVLIAAAEASGITTAGAAAITIPELASLVGSLGGGYNVTGQVGFLMKNASLWYLKGVFGTNYYNFDGLFGMPTHISDDMAAIAATNKAVLFGNWNYLGVVEKPGMIVQRNPYLYMANGQIGIFASIFRGYAVLQAEAFKTLLQHA